MNEQIRELAEQASFRQFIMPKSNSLSSLDNCNGVFTEQDAIEKFAELIVAEMLQTCEDHPGWSGRMIGEQIKQDFGVDE